MQIEYLNINDYKLPNLTVNERKDYSIGKYGLILLNSLKTNKKGLYQELLIKDKLTDYLIDMDKYMSNRINHLTRILADKENINEKIKEEEQLRWVGLMNNYKNIAEEIVLKEVINDYFVYKQATDLYSRHTKSNIKKGCDNDGYDIYLEY